MREFLFDYVFFFDATATTEIYAHLNTLSLHDALPIFLLCCTPFGSTVRSTVASQQEWPGFDSRLGDQPFGPFCVEFAFSPCSCVCFLRVIRFPSTLQSHALRSIGYAKFPLQIGTPHV